MSGDSGGPAFIDKKIAGVISGNTKSWDYDVKDEFKRLQDSFDWIEKIIKTDGG